MICGIYFIYFFAITSFTGSVKVNMHGSLSLGTDVMDTLSHYLQNKLTPHVISGRRSYRSNSHSITKEIKAGSLCKDLQLCPGDLDMFVSEYVTALTRTVEDVFDGVLDHKVSNSVGTFSGKLTGILREIRKILKTANNKVSEEKEAHIWMGVLKKISAKIQRKAIVHIVDRLDAAPDELDEVKKKMTQSLVVNIAFAEAKASRGLCYEFRICTDAIKCTTALNAILSRLRKSSDNKIRHFIRAFYNALSDTFFYIKLRPETAKEFQNILNDMAFADNVPTREILKSVQESLERRINSMHSSSSITGQDIQLLNTIMSDMDYLYNKHKSDPFKNILDNMLEWARVGGRISSYMKDAIAGIEDILYGASEDLMMKVISEVRVFLEITVEA